jgi:hypothetical protein
MSKMSHFVSQQTSRPWAESIQFAAPSASSKQNEFGACYSLKRITADATAAASLSRIASHRIASHRKDFTSLETRRTTTRAPFISARTIPPIQRGKLITRGSTSFLSKMHAIVIRDFYLKIQRLCNPDVHTRSASRRVKSSKFNSFPEKICRTSRLKLSMKNMIMKISRIHFQ